MNQRQKVPTRAHRGVFILFSSIAGLDLNLLDEMQNLLNLEEDVCILFSTVAGKLCGLAALRLDNSLKELILGKHDRTAIDVISNVDKYFILRECLQGVETIADLKQFYLLLSNRENNHLCSKYFYDQLIEIFIETKEFLK